MIIRAEEGTYVRGEAPATMYSGALGPCIGVGAMYKNKGFLAHDSSDSLVLLDSLLEDLKNEVRHMEDLSIYVGGGCLEFHSEMLQDCAEMNRMTLNLRRRTLQKIAHAGFDVKAVLWGTHDAAIELYLDLATRTHRFKRLSTDDLSFASELGFLR